MRFKKVISLIILIISFALFITGCKNTSSNSNEITDSQNIFKLVTLNVGKADCIIISYKEKNIMIDTGTSDSKDTIFKYLSDNNIDTLDYLILTHYDKDHIGSADKIIKKINVKNVLEPDYSKDSKEYNNLVKALSKKDLNANIITSEYNFNIYNVEFKIYPSLKKDYGENASNEFSLVTSIKHNDNTFLLAGDAENERLTELEKQMNLNHTFLKVPHHGKIDDNSENFINKVNPKYAVITCSEDEEPSKKIIKYLDNLNTKTYLSYNGTITALSDGTNLTVTQ